MSEARSLYSPEWLTLPENPADLSRSIWTDSFTRNALGELCIDGQTVSELAAEHGTPQYVFSETTFRARARAYRTAFEQAFAAHGAQVSVYYAGKSFLSTAVVRWVREEGLCLDTASGGELALALRGGMPGERIALHGNNKSEAEIARAIRSGLGRVVADSVDEIKLIERVYAELAAERVAEGEEPYPPVPVLIRITPGVHASTHESIATAHEDQKFGMSLRLLFEQLRDIRRDVRIPLVLMGYLNPIMQFGFEAFCQKCVECGIDGVIIPDLPFRDYEESYKAIASKYDIRVIMLITPETSEARVREIDAHTDGFIYLVSSAATTGAQKDFDTRKQAYFKKIEDMNLRNPRMVGFGISNKQTFDAACAHSSGAIIGSRFVTLLNEKEGDAEKAIRQLKEDLKQ